MANHTWIDIKDTVGHAVERWLYRQKKDSVKPSTFDRLLGTYKLLTHYPLSKVRLIDLCTDDIQQFVNRLNAEAYSLSAIRKAYNLMTGFVSYALGEGLPIRPAHINVTLPKVENLRKQPKQVQAYDPAEQRRLREAIQKLDTTGAKAVLLMLETGMRAGELLALQWSDILWGRKAVRISSTLARPGGRKKAYVQSSPKTKSSNRTIPLSRTALKMLNDMGPRDDGFIFTADDGTTTIGYNTLRDHAQELCALANVPYHGLHIMRHTFATNAFYKGCDIKILSKLLGHASVTITYNIYIHLFGDALEEMRSIVE